MVSMWGANTEELRRVGDSFSSASTDIDAGFAGLNSQVEAVVWFGPDAERFRSEWSEKAAAMAHALAELLVTNNTDLQAQSDHQDETSSSNGSGGMRSHLGDAAGSMRSHLGEADRGSSANATSTADGSRGDASSGAEHEMIAASAGDGPGTQMAASRTVDEVTGERRHPRSPDAPSEFDPEGLGEPVPGTEAEKPAPPPWQPGDEGSGAHGQRDATLKDRAVWAAARAAADAAALVHPDASRNLQHYLNNSGEDLEIDVDRMIEDMPPFQEAMDQQLDPYIDAAIEEAKRRGADGPLTFPVNTPWSGFDSNGVDDNWFYATGGFSYNQTGTITVYPPEPGSNEYTYEYDVTTNVRDQYNWDGQKSTNFFDGKVNISDKTLQELHQSGLAQEYMLYGESESRSGSGSR